MVLTVDLSLAAPLEASIPVPRVPSLTGEPKPAPPSLWPRWDRALDAADTSVLDDVDPLVAPIDVVSIDVPAVPDAVGSPGFGGHPRDQEKRWAGIPFVGVHLLEKDELSFQVDLPADDYFTNRLTSNYGFGLSYRIEFR